MQFGDWLKRYRLICNSTQQHMAQQLGYAVITYRRVEQGRFPSKPFVDRLMVHLKLPADEEAAFRHFALTNDHPDAEMLLVLLTQAGSKTTFPHTNGIVTREDRAVSLVPSDDAFPRPRTSLIGRTDEKERIHELLCQSTMRLVTLTGVGGLGKTKLAVHVANDLKVSFPDGVKFVDLTVVTDPDTVLSKIAHTLNIPELGGISILEQLQSYFKHRHVLLVLDNFEQVIDSAPVVAQLLDRAPHLKLLVTSRMPLQVHGEYIVALTPLYLPALAPLPPLTQLAMVPAVALLFMQMRSVQSEVTLTGETAEALAHICHQAGGIPLALELAAARLRVLSPARLLERLVTQQEVLVDGMRDGPARHQSMDSTIEWSYQLLDPISQQMLLRLAVFKGSCTLEAIEQICGDGDFRREGMTFSQNLDPLERPVLDILTTLLDSSFITRSIDSDGTVRFNMLTPIHTYARTRLQREPEMHVLAERHACYYLALVEQAAPEFVGPHQHEWLVRIETEYDNLRQVLTWVINQQLTILALRFGVALWFFWYIRGYIWEGSRWLDNIVTLADKTETTMYAVILCRYAILLTSQGQLVKAQQYCESSLAMCRRLNDRKELGAVLGNAGIIAHRCGNYAQATYYLEEAIAVNQSDNNRHRMATALNTLAGVARSQSNLPQAYRHYQESLAIYEEIGSKIGVAKVLSNLSFIAWSNQDSIKAHELLTEALQISRHLNHRETIVDCLLNLASVALSQHNVSTAQQHLAEIAPIIQDLGDVSLGVEWLEGIAGLCSKRQHLLLAARFWGSAKAIRTTIRVIRSPSENWFCERLIAEAHSQVDRSTWEAAWIMGQQLSWYEALEEVLELKWFSMPFTNVQVFDV
ncbi:MAG: tetratricopeptide repeat protein [Chloroflexota bacterium]